MSIYIYSQVIQVNLYSMREMSSSRTTLSDFGNAG